MSKKSKLTKKQNKAISKAISKLSTSISWVGTDNFGKSISELRSHLVTQMIAINKSKTTIAAQGEFND